MIYTEDNVNKAQPTLSVLPQKNWEIKSKTFHGAVQSDNAFFAGSTIWIFFIVETWFSIIFLQTAAKIPWFKS